MRELPLQPFFCSATELNESNQYFSQMFLEFALARALYPMFCSSGIYNIASPFHVAR